MKRLSTILIAILLFSCKQEAPIEPQQKIDITALEKMHKEKMATLSLLGKPLYSTGTEWMHERLYKPASQRYMASVSCMDDVQGMETTVKVINLGGNDLQGVFIDGELAMTDGRHLWIQTGWHQWGGVSYFTMVFGRNGWNPPNAIQLKPYPVLASGTVYRFGFQIRSGNLYIQLDGEDMGYLPLGNISHFEYSAITLESVGTTTRPLQMPSIRFNPALKLYNNGVWYAAPSGYFGGTGYKVQVNAPNDVNMGSIKSDIPYYSVIW